MSTNAVTNIHTIAFVGHGAVGKTTLVDALLYHVHAVERTGSVDDGTSYMDYDDEEKARHCSIDSSLSPITWKGKQLQFIDCPGYPDFIGQAIAAVNNVETAAIVIDAHRGIEINTRRMFEEAQRAGIACVFILTKFDSDNIDFAALLSQIQETFGKECVLVQAPVGIGSAFSGVIDVLHPPAEIPDGTVLDAAVLRDQLIERIVETDDAMLERYFEGEIPSNQVLAETLEHAVVSGRIRPIFCVCSKRGTGLSELLDDLIELSPTPHNEIVRQARHHNGNVDEMVPLDADPDKPLVARVFKTHADRFGNLTYLRVYQGTLHNNMTVKCSRDGSSHRLGQLLRVTGKQQEKIDEAGPGELVCVAKVEGVEINDTLSIDGDWTLPPIEFPRPMFPLAIHAKSRGDDVKVMSALRKLAHEDPCFEFHREEETLETVMSGVSQLHLDVMQHRLKQREGIELETHEPKVAYKESIRRAGDGTYRHKKQTGGRGQFAEVHLRLKPRERGEGFQFVNSVVGGSIPTQYIPAVEKGVRETLARGILAGSEIVDLEVEVHFGKYHDVDSSEQAFKYAASMAFKEAFLQCEPVLLEPIVEIEVTAPVDRMGDINGDLNSRRAQITGMDTLAGGMQLVQAQVPLGEVLRYQTELKSLTGGQGSYTMQYSHLAPLPPHVQQQVVAKYGHNGSNGHHD